MRLRIGQQLALAFGSMVLLAAVLALVGWGQIKVIQHHFNGVVDRTLPTLGALADVQERLQQLRVAELQHLAALTMPEKDREEVKVKEAAKTFDATAKSYFEISNELDDAALIAQFKDRIAVFHKNRIKFFQMSNSAAGAEIERAQEAREYFNGEGLRAFLGAAAAAQQLRVHHTRQADAAKALGAAALSWATQLLLGVGAAIVVLSVLLAVFITRRVTRPIGGEPADLANIAQRIGDGDLSVPIPSRPRGDRSLMGVMGQMQTALREMVSELRVANESLQKDIAQRAFNEAKLKLAASVFHTTMDGVMIIDPARRVVSVNPAFVRITGYSAEEALGQPTNWLRSEIQSAEAHLEKWATVERDGHWQGESWFQRRDGEAFLALVNIVVVLGSDGRPERYVTVFHDITEIRRKEEQIRHLAFHDALTGLPNRTLLHDRLDQAIEAARRDAEPLGLMFIDLDRFKAVNDSFGHDAGNGLLKEVADRLRNCLRKSDTVARVGGDEFVVLLRRVEVPPNYGFVAEKIIAALSMPMTLDGHAMQVGASIGISCFPDDGIDTVELMKHADAAMYAAKAAGSGTYRFFQPAMTEKAVHRLQLEMQLRSAVPNGELELFYQPKVSLTTGAACGVEALVRWRHPVLGLLPPGEFIPMAESNGIIGELGDWALEEACRQSSEWQIGGLGKVKIAVNVSARQLQQHDLVERIEDLARRYQIHPSDLEIELTESVLMVNPQEIAGVLARLRAIGVVVAVDDFGTGYSSLAYLRRLPIDVLKIDRSFVMNADCDEGDAQVVKLILAFGQALNLAIVAEGVETESQAEFLRSCGCTTAQGYLYSRPQPAAQIEAWMRHHGRSQLAAD